MWPVPGGEPFWMALEIVLLFTLILQYPTGSIVSGKTMTFIRMVNHNLMRGVVESYHFLLFCFDDALFAYYMWWWGMFVCNYATDVESQLALSN